MRLEVTLPNEYVGDITNDLQQRRAMVNQTFFRGRSTVIEAEAPLKSLFGYANAVKGLSQGHASFSMEPHTYRAVPKEVMDELL